MNTQTAFRPLPGAMATKLTDKQYSTLLDLYHELNEAFQWLPREYQDAFYARLHGPRLAVRLQERA